MREFGWATESEREQIDSLWQQAFGDGAAFFDCFWKTCFSPGRILVLRLRGQIAAMATVFSVSLAGERLWYLYGVATQPALQGEGLASALMEQAAVLALTEGAAGLAVVPGEASLRAFYEARGYCPWGRRAERIVTATETAPEGWTIRISAEEYEALREQQLDGIVHIRPDRTMLAMAQASSELSGGGLFRLELNGMIGCAAVSVERNRLYVPELLVPTGAEAQAAALLLAGIPATEGCFCTPGGEAPFGMVRLWRHGLPLQGYLGLALD
jgi:GNAT superfamily N-acetyltransferase